MGGGGGELINGEKFASAIKRAHSLWKEGFIFAFTVSEYFYRGKVKKPLQEGRKYNLTVSSHIYC